MCDSMPVKHSSAATTRSVRSVHGSFGRVRHLLVPEQIIASPETLFRMADGFARPDSEFRDFAYGMKAAIEARSDQYGGPLL